MRSRGSSATATVKTLEKMPDNLSTNGVLAASSICHWNNEEVGTLKEWLRRCDLIFPVS